MLITDRARRQSSTSNGLNQYNFMANVPTNMGPPMELGCGPADPALSATIAGNYAGTGYNPVRGGTGEVGTINPGANTPVASQGQPAQLRGYVLGGQLYLVDSVTGTAYTVGPALQVPQPPIYSPTK